MMFLTAFYATLVPAGILISVFNLITTYWVDKYNLLRRRRQPKMTGQALLHSMFDMLESIPFVFVVGNYIWT
jgi:hypothetical protein